MIVYSFRPDGVYSGQVDVAGPGWPPNTTPDVPPQLSEGEYAVFTKGRWEIVVGEKPVFPPIENPTPEQIQQKIISQTQNRLDEFAATRGYDNVNSISKYQNISDDEISLLPLNEQPQVIKFRAECRYLAISVARTWAKLYLILNEIVSGVRDIPSEYADIESELPTLEWPI